MTGNFTAEDHLLFLSLKSESTCQNATLLEITCRGSYMLNAEPQFPKANDPYNLERVRNRFA